MITNKLTRLGLFNLANFFLYNFANSFLSGTLGKVLFGHLMLSLSLLGALAPILLMGNYYLLVEEVPKHITNKNRQQLKGFLKWSLFLLLKSVIITTVFMAVLLILQHTGFLTCHHRTCNNDSLFYLDALYIAPLYILMLWNIEYLLTLHEPNLGTVLSADTSTGILIYIFSVIIAIAATLFGTLHYTETLIIFILAQLILLICQYCIIQLKHHKALSISLQNAFSANKLPATQQINLIKRSILFVPCDILYALVGISIVSTVEFTHPLKETLSDYYICGFIGSIINVITSTLQTNMWSLYSTAGIPKHKKATRDLETLIKKMVTYGGIWLIFSAIAINTFFPYIKDIYEIKNPNMLMGLGLQMTFYYLSPIWTQPENILTYHEKTTAVYIGNIIQIIMQVALCYLLVDIMGFIGALVATLAGDFTCAFICFIALKRNRIAIKPFGYC